MKLTFKFKHVKIELDLAVMASVMICIYVTLVNQGLI